VIFFFFLSLAMWMYSLYLSLKPTANPLPAYPPDRIIEQIKPNEKGWRSEESDPSCKTGK
jgi:hypothetical protein